MELKKETIIKIFAGISVIAIGLAIFFYLNKEEYLFWLSVIANVIQVILFLFWFFESSSLPIKEIKEIHEYTTKEKSEDKKRMKIIAQLMKAGLVPSDEVKKAFKSLKLEEVIIVHTYGEGLSEHLIKEFGLEKQPLITLIKDLGFVKVFGYSNLYIAFKDSLPRKLRRLDNLESYLMIELKKKWEELQSFTKKKYPKEKYKIYSKMRDGTGFKCSYILLKSLKEECVIDYENRPSFTKDFVEKVLGKYQTKKNVLSSVQVKNFILGIKMNVLLEDKVDKSRAKKIISKEKEIKDELKITRFYDFKDKSTEVIARVIKDKTGLEESKEEAELIKIEAEEYYNSLKEMNLI